MATPFIVYLPDYVGAAAGRKEHYSAHIASFTSWVEKGLVSTSNRHLDSTIATSVTFTYIAESAGMLVANPQLEGGEEQPGIGSVAVILADSLDAVRSLVATDPFWINGVVSFRIPYVLSVRN